jgi:signal transduction histidine kinase
LPDDEIGRLAHTFEGMFERLDRAFQRERQLTSDVFHELRTPLGMMKTQLSLARSRPRDAAALLQMMADMEGDVDRMTQLAEQMLTLARVEQRGLSDFEPLALDELLQEVVDRFQNKGHERGVTVFLKPPPQVDWHLEGDREQLRIVFANLLDNAVKYTPSGKPVRVSVSRYWQTFWVEVTDSEMGIAPEHLPRLFERFDRADSARARATGGFGPEPTISQAIYRPITGKLKSRASRARAQPLPSSCR